MLVISFKLNLWIACSCSLLAGLIEWVFIDGKAYSNRNQPASVFLQKGSDIKETEKNKSFFYPYRQTQMFCDLGGWLWQHAWPALHMLPSDLAFCCVGLTHNSSLISHSGHPVRTDCRTRFPGSIKLTACESLNPVWTKSVRTSWKSRGRRKVKQEQKLNLITLNCTKNISLHSGRVMIHLIPLNKRVASDTICYFRCLQSFKQTNKKTCEK